MKTTSSFSSFWPMQIIVTCLGIWAAYQLWEINSDRLVTEHGIRQMLKTGESAVVAKKKLFSLVEDLTRVSSVDPNAGQILQKFKIQLQGAPASSAMSNK
jgi:hypothetical protein